MCQAELFRLMSHNRSWKNLHGEETLTAVSNISIGGLKTIIKRVDKHNECPRIPALTGDDGGVVVNGRGGAARQPLMISPLFQRTEKSHYLPPHYPAIPHMLDGSSLP